MLWLTVIAVVAALLLGELVIQIGVAAVVVPAAAAALAAIIWRPKIGLYAVMALVLLFEIDLADPLMLPGRYFNYGLQSLAGSLRLHRQPAGAAAALHDGSLAGQGAGPAQPAAIGAATSAGRRRCSSSR